MVATSFHVQYVEISNLSAARKILKRRQNAMMPSGSLHEGRKRPVTITMVTHQELAAEASCPLLAPLEREAHVRHSFGPNRNTNSSPSLPCVKLPSLRPLLLILPPDTRPRTLLRAVWRILSSRAMGLSMPSCRSLPSYEDQRVLHTGICSVSYEAPNLLC